jgi:hypothetical protein
MAANSHTTAEYAATNTVPKNTAPMSHETTNTTAAGSSRNLAYALAMGPAEVSSLRLDVALAIGLDLFECPGVRLPWILRHGVAPFESRGLYPPYAAFECRYQAHRHPFAHALF